MKTFKVEKQKDETTWVGLRVSIEDHDWLMRVASDSDTSVSEVVRKAIKFAKEHYEGDEKSEQRRATSR